MTRGRFVGRRRIDVRSLAAAAIALSLILLAGARPAAADSGPAPATPTSLVVALQQLDRLNTQVDALTLRVATLQLQVKTLTSGFDRVTRRIALLQDRRRQLWATTSSQSYARIQSSPLLAADAELGSRIAATRDRLATLQQRATADPVVTQLFAAQTRLDALTAERDRALADAASLQAAGIVVPVNASGTSIGYGAWAAEFLQTLGAPVCQSNLIAMVAWQSSEGTTASWNPLATTLSADGATDFNGVGVKNYPSLAIGLAATVDTLRYGLVNDGYGPVVTALQACAPPDATAAAINRSLWCRGCAGGHYVTSILPAVEANYAEYAAGP